MQDKAAWASQREELQGDRDALASKLTLAASVKETLESQLALVTSERDAAVRERDAAGQVLSRTCTPPRCLYKGAMHVTISCCFNIKQKMTRENNAHAWPDKYYKKFRTCFSAFGLW